MKQLSDITRKLKMTKFRVSLVGEQAIDVQKAMFRMGFRDFRSESGEVRVARTSGWNGNPIHAFFIDDDCRIEHSTYPATIDNAMLKGYREIGIIEVFDASREFVALEKELRTQRKLEKRLVREGWSINTGVAVPEAIRVLFKDGTERYGAGDWTIPYYANDGKTVVGYKLEAAPVAAAVSLAEMVAGIVADAGGVEVDADGFIVWTGEGYVSNNNNMGGPVAKGTKVDVKYRDGEIQYGGVAGVIDGPSSASGYYPAGAYWHNDGRKNDIVAYRLSPTTKVAVQAEVLDSANKVIGFTRVADVADLGQYKHNTLAEMPVQADTNPKRQYGVTSIPLNMWSTLASAYGALGLYNGSLKYGKANFANTKVEASIYIAAALRHLSAWAAGEEFDPADGVPNLGGVLANIAILLEARAAGMLIDDRLLMAGFLKERDALKDIVKSLNELHAGKDPRHYTIAGV